MPRSEAVERIALLRRRAERLRAEQVNVTATVAEEHAQRDDFVCRWTLGKHPQLVEAGAYSQIGRAAGDARRKGNAFGGEFRVGRVRIMLMIFRHARII